MKNTVFDQARDQRSQTSSSSAKKHHLVITEKFADFAIMRHKLLNYILGPRTSTLRFLLPFVRAHKWRDKNLHSTCCNHSMTSVTRNSRTFTDFTSKIHRFFGQIQYSKDSNVLNMVPPFMTSRDKGHKNSKTIAQNVALPQTSRPRCARGEAGQRLAWMRDASPLIVAAALEWHSWYNR